MQQNTTIPDQFRNCPPNPPSGGFFCHNDLMRNLQITEAEEEVLVSLCALVFDLGCPDHIDESVLDSLWEKISDPSPFDYS